jgi:polyketide synthase PksN
MRVDPGLESMMEQHTGLVPMATATGLAAFYRGLALEAGQVMVLEGDTGLLRRSLGLAPSGDHQATGAALPHERGSGGDAASYRRLAEGIMNGDVSAEQMETMLLGLE